MAPQPTSTTPEAAERPSDTAEQADPSQHSDDTNPEEGQNERRAAHFPLLREIESLDLSEAQRADLVQIREQLHDDMAPARAAVRDLTELYAAGLEQGKVDHEAVDAQQKVIATEVENARLAFEAAANAVHSTLTPAQRGRLMDRVLEMHDLQSAEAKEREESENAAENPASERARPHGKLARIADELGITADQRKAILGSARGAFETAFPERKARRLEKEARVRAIAEAFRSDDFDAHSFGFGKESESMFKGVGEVSHTVANVANVVLTSEQRAGLAKTLRDRAPKH